MPPLSPQELRHLEERLLEERARSLRALGLWETEARRVRAEGDSELAVYRDHMADQGTESMEREKAALFATKEGRYLYRLEEALHRLRTDPEHFGLCQATGRPIGFARLDALPHARYCIDHKRSLEAAGE
jgi:RNA polymerase-binding transcription factor DksA